MSCWVVPAVAAEYWGVTLDVVWDRIYSDLVPHKTERGFVFIDVDPWNPNSAGASIHQAPPTFVPIAAGTEACPALSDTLVCDEELDPEEDELLSDESLSQEEGVLPDEDELPGLDEEESATFGRLGWQEVRQSVSRTRRPPPKMQNSS